MVECTWQEPNSRFHAHSTRNGLHIKIFFYKINICELKLLLFYITKFYRYLNLTYWQYLWEPCIHFYFGLEQCFCTAVHMLRLSVRAEQNLLVFMLYC